jgi:hypothetical protein
MVLFQNFLIYCILLELFGFLKLVKNNKSSCPEEVIFNDNSTQLKTYKQRFLSKLGVNLEGLGDLGKYFI